MLCRKSYCIANRPNRGDHSYSYAQLQKKWREKKRNRLMEMPKVLTLKGKFTNAPLILFTYFSWKNDHCNVFLVTEFSLHENWTNTVNVEMNGIGNRLGWKNVGRIKTKTFPLVMGALGTIKKDMENYSNKIPGNINIHELQKIILLSTAHLLMGGGPLHQVETVFTSQSPWFGLRCWERKSLAITLVYL